MSLKTALKISVLCLIAFLAIPIHSHALTLSEIRVCVRRNVNDKADPKIKLTDNEITAYINEGQNAVARQTWMRVNIDSNGSLTAGTTYIMLASSLTIRVSELTVDKVPLKQMSMYQLDAEKPNWRLETGTPTVFYHDSYQDRVGLYPFPNTSGGVYRIHGTFLSTPLLAGTDAAFDGAFDLYAFHDLLIFYATFRILTVHGRAPEAAAYKQLYDAGIQSLREVVASKQRPMPEILDPDIQKKVTP